MMSATRRAPAAGAEDFAEAAPSTLATLGARRSCAAPGGESASPNRINTKEATASLASAKRRGPIEPRAARSSRKPGIVHLALRGTRSPPRPGHLLVRQIDLLGSGDLRKSP